MTTTATTATSDALVVPCKWCGNPTRMTGTKMCDNCWEMDGRIRSHPALARRMLAAAVLPEQPKVCSACGFSLGHAKGCSSIAALAAQAPSPVAPNEHICGICFNDPERCDIHDCGDMHQRAAIPDAPVAPSDDMNPIKEGWQISVTSGHSGYGVYAHMSECPEEGAVLVAAIPDEKAKPVAIVIAAHTTPTRIEFLNQSDKTLPIGTKLYVAPIQPRQAERPMADTAPPATARERWFYEQGRLAERDPRTPKDEPRQAPSDALMPEIPTPAMLYALWKHRDMMHGQSEKAIARAHYAELRAEILFTQGDRQSPNDALAAQHVADLIAAVLSNLIDPITAEDSENQATDSEPTTPRSRK